jgi:EAL domain-containing protein (putative c-di-GMP-specific phosphodiesterase class I)
LLLAGNVPGKPIIGLKAAGFMLSAMTLGETDFSAEALGLDLMLFYQPIVSVESGRVIGAEALARVRPPGMEPISGFAAVQQIERDGRGPALARWTVSVAIKAAQYWRSIGLLVPVHVNVGASALSPESAESFYQWLKAVDMDYSLLTLEITETEQISDHESAAHLVHACRELGLEVAIDDFGCGYSTLELLQRIPTDMLKIDRRFISRVVDDPRTAVIVTRVIELAHSLGARVVGEGVEDRATWCWLEDAGCDLIQGYVVEQAMPDNEFARWNYSWNRSLGAYTKERWVGGIRRDP